MWFLAILIPIIASLITFDFLGQKVDRTKDKNVLYTLGGLQLVQQADALVKELLPDIS